MITDIPKTKLIKLLESIKSRNGKINLFEHLEKLYEIKKELNDDEKYSDLFEDISVRLKKQGYYFCPEINNANLNSNLNKDQAPDQKVKNLLSPLTKSEGENQEKTVVTNVNYVPDYVELFNKFSFCGLSLGTKESLLLTNSLRNLSSTLGAGQVSFFGKIFGTTKDYYVAEATDIDAAPDTNYENDMEKRKEDGFNRNVFFVTNNLWEKWVELPDVKPKQIIISRKIKYFFTGNLNKKIHSNPDFPGEERHLLRCILGRIYHGTKLVPSINHYTIEDPENPYKQLTPAEKPKKFTNEILNDKKYWIHYPPGVLKCGRVSHIIDDAPEGIEPEEYKKTIINKDPFDKRLEPIENDKKIKIGCLGSNDYLYINPWKIEQCYEDNIYVNPYIKLLDETQPDFDPLEQKDNKMNYSCIVVKSLRWPGAVNIYSNKECYFFYFGNGMKQEDNNLSTSEISTDYCFKIFPNLPKDIQDKVDQPEPHSKEQAQPEQQPNNEKK